MKSNSIFRNSFVRAFVTACLILLIPAIDMQFNDQMNWGREDFIAAGILLFLAGMALDLIVTKWRGRNRIIAIGILGIIFMYIWAELAVGVFTHLGS